MPGFVGRSRTEAACASHLEWRAALAEGGTYTELAKGGTGNEALGVGEGKAARL